MKRLLVSAFILSLVPFANAQSLSDALCQSHKSIMEQTILSWRQSGQIPIGAAQSILTDVHVAVPFVNNLETEKNHEMSSLCKRN